MLFHNDFWPPQQHSRRSLRLKTTLRPSRSPYNNISLRPSADLSELHHGALSTEEDGTHPCIRIIPLAREPVFLFILAAVIALPFFARAWSTSIFSFFFPLDIQMLTLLFTCCGEGRGVKWRRVAHSRMNLVERLGLVPLTFFALFF